MNLNGMKIKDVTDINDVLALLNVANVEIQDSCKKLMNIQEDIRHISHNQNIFSLNSGMQIQAKEEIYKQFKLTLDLQKKLDPEYLSSEINILITKKFLENFDKVLEDNLRIKIEVLVKNFDRKFEQNYEILKKTKDEAHEIFEVVHQLRSDLIDDYRQFKYKIKEKINEKSTIKSLLISSIGFFAGLSFMFVAIKLFMH